MLALRKNSNATNYMPAAPGVSRGHADFSIRTAELKPDAASVMDLLCGRGVGLHVKHYLGSSDCDQIARNVAGLTGAVRSDVPAIKLGADHFGKSLEHYLKEVAETRDLLKALFRGAVDVPEVLLSDLRDCLEPGMTIRPARHGDRNAGRIRAVKWVGGGPLALQIHDDNSQLTQPAQAGFEIQEVRVPVAVNVYPVAEANCGNLRVFNLRVNPSFKACLRIEHSGYPVPEELLSGVEFLDISVDPGDLVLLDGRYLHCVTSGPGNRLLLNSFAGLLADAATVVIWT